MCRLLGIVSETPVTAPGALGTGFDDFVGMSAGKHRDGWGIVGDTGRGRRLARSIGAAHASAGFRQAAASTAMTAGIIHLRAATGGLAVSEQNTHPFEAGDVAFAHNGQVEDITAIDALLDDDLRAGLTGDTDSERYFHTILSEARRAPLTEAVRRAVLGIESVTATPSLNAMLLTPQALVIVSSFDEAQGDGFGGDYFELRYRERADSIVVASTGWPQPGWRTVPPRSILRIDRATRALTVTSIDTGRVATGVRRINAPATLDSQAQAA